MYCLTQGCACITVKLERQEHILLWWILVVFYWRQRCRNTTYSTCCLNGTDENAASTSKRSYTHCQLLLGMCVHCLRVSITILVYDSSDLCNIIWPSWLRASLSVADGGGDMVRTAAELSHAGDKWCLLFVVSKGNMTDEKPKIGSQTKAVTERKMRAAIIKIIIDLTEAVHASYH